MTKVIDLNDYNVNQMILIGIIKIINEKHNTTNIKNLFETSNPEIIRFINDCSSVLES